MDNIHLSISNSFASSTIYDKHDDFDFDTVNFPFLMMTFSVIPLIIVYISQLIRFARVFIHVHYLNARDKCLTAKLLTETGLSVS